jgi:REP element-mobilizing transposase RayT
MKGAYMPRRARREHETSFFHVIVQGIEKKFIFNRKEYIERYIDLLFYEKEKNKKVRILAYCIMNNHAHILLGVENVKSLSEYLRVVNARYAMFYNNKEQRVGYVFRDRYKSEPIYNHDYLYKCLAYIHLNPVEAGMVDEPNMYKYSSYNDYIKKTGIAWRSVDDRRDGSRRWVANPGKYSHKCLLQAMPGRDG